jgi:glycosyltransferase involved in cell wall biosynthesis
MRVFRRAGAGEKARARALRAAAARRAPDRSETAAIPSPARADPVAPLPNYRNQDRIPEFEAIRQSGLFDAAFYEAQLRRRGERLGDLDPLEHYVTQGDAARIAPNPLFDPKYYAETNPDVEAAGICTLVHFVNYGVDERRGPHPLFDVALVRQQLGPKFTGNPLAAYLRSQGPRLRPHALIDPGYIWKYQRTLARSDTRPCLLFYLEQDPDLYNPSPSFDAYSYARMYPDLNGMHPLVHYARYGRSEGRRIAGERDSLKTGRSQVDFMQRVRDQIEAAARLDPDIIRPFVDSAKIPVSINYNLERTEYRLWSRLRGYCGTRTYSHVFLTPWLKRGGAERVIANLSRALLTRAEDDRILILCTAGDSMDAASWAPLSDRVTIAAINDGVDDANNTYIAFCNFLRFAHCQHLYVVNSEFGWGLIEKYGHALLPFVTSHGFVFCYDYDSAGRRAGAAWTHLRAASPRLCSMVSDNNRTIEQFAADQYWDSREREGFFCLPQPVDAALEGRATEQLAYNLARADHGRPLVLWAGRFDRQKGLEVVLEIAAAMPDIDFQLCGGELASDPDAADRPPENVSARGEYQRFADLPLNEASAFLHTSHWDGLPNVLLEASCAGLPVVATDVGGVADLVDAGTGWLIPHGAGVDAYVAALRDLFQYPDATLEKCRRMSSRIAAAHSSAVFAEGVSRLLEFGARRRRALLERAAGPEARS